MLNVRIKEKHLVNEFDNFGSTDLQITLIQIKKIATLATKAVLNANLNKIVKLQAFDSICFCGKSNFEDNDTQKYLMFQLVFRYFKNKF